MVHAIFYTHQTSGMCAGVCVRSHASNGKYCPKENKQAGKKNFYFQASNPLL